jgi:hypothetical protein
VTEAKNPAGDFFAQSDLRPLHQLVNNYGHLPTAKELLEAILWELYHAVRGQEERRLSLGGERPGDRSVARPRSALQAA